ncbi:hypothetical protein [Lentzea jiangxiensis]|uniref:DUF4232 domain-containing protein n=1 Tax=Lentzea jiangxiensis TaxID=641025 RepID=A0A1H0F039_9PSEU|nr:hypothetical protein [Lentzea jiangxiensis]SDN88037.1 hypothetical protein SAMN05421507_101589 [Lentzea jiangxiensis]
MNRFRKSATIGSLVAVAALALAGTSAAQAAGTSSAAPWCTGDDLVIAAHDMRPTSNPDKGHVLSFTAAEGVTCTIGGSLSNVRFLDAKGQDMNVPLTGGQGQYTETTVHGIFASVVYIGSPKKSLSVTPAFIQFDLPGQGSLGDRITTAWPSWIGVPVQIGNIMWPVS